MFIRQLHGNKQRLGHPTETSAAMMGFARSIMDSMCMALGVEDLLHYGLKHFPFLYMSIHPKVTYNHNIVWLSIVHRIRVWEFYETAHVWACNFLKTWWGERLLHLSGSGIPTNVASCVLFVFVSMWEGNQHSLAILDSVEWSMPTFEQCGFVGSQIIFVVDSIPKV